MIITAHVRDMGRSGAGWRKYKVTYLINGHYLCSLNTTVAFAELAREYFKTDYGVISWWLGRHGFRNTVDAEQAAKLLQTNSPKEVLTLLRMTT